MISKRELKELAELTVSEGKVSKRTADFILKKFSISELKEFLCLLRRETAKNRVFVRTAGELDSKSREMISRKYRGKEIIFEMSDKLGAGMEIQADDEITRMNIKNMLEKTFQQLRENL
ncbi:MAG: hypothetical protein ABII64_07215 [Elusimicrobiota bacterium]